MTITRSLVLALLVLSTQGCLILSPILSSYHDSGVAASDRRRLFAHQTKLFHEALEWGSVDEAVGMAKEESQPAIAKSLIGFRRGQKYAGATVEFVEFSDDAYNAEAHVRARSYAPDNLVLQEQLHLERWEFSVGSGWRLVTREPMAGG